MPNIPKTPANGEKHVYLRPMQNGIMVMYRLRLRMFEHFCNHIFEPLGGSDIICALYRTCNVCVLTHHILRTFLVFH